MSNYLFFYSNSTSYIRTCYILVISLLVTPREYYPTHAQSQGFAYVQQGPVMSSGFPGSLLLHTHLGIVLPAIKSVVLNILGLRSCRNLPISKQVAFETLDIIHELLNPTYFFQDTELMKKNFLVWR